MAPASKAEKPASTAGKAPVKSTEKVAKKTSAGKKTAAPAAGAGDEKKKRKR
ncbi:hypothetical protein FRC00_014437, partial [Tulasnella sp. 408]